MARVLICGDRYWKNFHRVAYVLSYFATKNKIEVVIEGECKGADIIGRVAAEQFGIPVMKFPADWTNGLKAGPIRNRQMLTEGKPDLVLAFHNDIAKSKGTKGMVKLAMKAGIETHVYTEEGEVNVRVG